MMRLDPPMAPPMRAPNILWLVSDHQALAGRPATAKNFSLQSRLANEGIRFERAYTVLPICSPSRASMLTGLYPSAHGLTENDGRFGGRTGLDPEDWMIQHVLKENGYRCGWFGKWHLHNTLAANDFGFEGFSLPGYGYPYCTDAYAEYLKRKALPAPQITVELRGESEISAGTKIDLTKEIEWFNFEAGTAVLDGSVESHEANFLTDSAIRWLQRIGDEPFFLRIDPWGPHPPYIVDFKSANTVFGDASMLSPNFSFNLDGRPDHHKQYRQYWQQTLKFDYSQWTLMAARAMQHVAIVEMALNNVVNKIDELGLAENTLVIFNADHGDAVGSNGGVANKGSLMVEETMRIPLLMRGPGIMPNSINHSLVTNIDIVPTLLDICGISVSSISHGRSLVPLFSSPQTALRDGLMAQNYGLHTPDLQRAYYQDHYKLVVQENGFTELYDLAVDPHETNNLANVSAHQETSEELRRNLINTMIGIGDIESRLTK